MNYEMSFIYVNTNANKHGEPKNKMKGSLKVKIKITIFEIIYERKVIEIYVFSKKVSEYYVGVMVGSNRKSI